MTEAALQRRALGIEGDTDAADIRRRHRALMLRWHPDHAPRGSEAAYLERAKQLNAARAWMLSHPSSWTVEAPVAPVVQPQVMRVENLPAQVPAWGPPVVVEPPMKPGTADGVWRILTVAVALYLGVLAFATVGWVLTALLTVLH